MDTLLTNELKADILVVDDIPDNVRVLSTMLLKQGYHVRKAISGQMALMAVRTTTPDLILLDINMPDMSGYEVCKELRSDRRTAQIPVIFLSALDDVLDKVKAFQVGGTDYVTKPFQSEEVLARIQHQLTIQELQAQLHVQNEQLRQALNHLKNTQAQLIQKEKLIGLEQFVAGVAHEFNNPISFIAGNLSPAHDYIQELLKLVKLYQTEYPHPTPVIQQAMEEIDLDFLLFDLKKLIGSMQTGVERIRTIILALRIFSHLDESDIKPVDVHHGLDSTLLLLNHRLSTKETATIKVIKNYGDLPVVTCYARQLNQVFFNLLSNAIDAVEVASRHHAKAVYEPTIWIETEVVDRNTIQIAIVDNGLGIPEPIKARLFEPFFTTKSAGQGTGLGLPTSYQIIVGKHGGTLTCHTSSEGTAFRIQIPARSPHLEGKDDRA
jgi:signal transduction histidine kinase